MFKENTTLTLYFALIVLPCKNSYIYSIFKLYALAT